MIPASAPKPETVDREVIKQSIDYMMKEYLNRAIDAARVMHDAEDPKVAHDARDLALELTGSTKALAALLEALDL